MGTEAENALTFFGEVEVERCEFCGEAFEDCECDDFDLLEDAEPY